MPRLTLAQFFGLFLAVLELIRIRQIEVDQQDAFGEITLSLVEDRRE